MRDKVIYERENFQILWVKGRYVVVNRLKEFKEGHTHLRSYGMAKGIIEYCVKKAIPNIVNDYLIISAIRLTDDGEYRERLIKEFEKRKGRKFYDFNEREEEKL